MNMRTVVIAFLLLAGAVLASNDTLALEEEEEDGEEGEELILGEVEVDPDPEVGMEDEEKEEDMLVNLEDNIVDTGRRRGETLDPSLLWEIILHFFATYFILRRVSNIPRSLKPILVKNLF